VLRHWWLCSGILKLKNQKPKYQITSPTSKLAETEDVKLYVHYNVQPWVGILTWTPQIGFGKWKLMRGGVSKLFNLPALKKDEQTQTAKA
jgi:signal peptidase complex subunit 3